jgi:hypothetical protein
MWIVLDAREPGLYVELVPSPELAAARQPSVRCRGGCQVSVLPGKYRLRVTKPGESPSERALTLSEPERLSIGPSNPSASNAGLALGIAGPVLIILSVALVIAELDCSYNSEREYQTCETPDWVPGAALIGILGGAAMTPIGWVMFAKNRRPSISRESLGTPRDSLLKPNVQLGTFRVEGGGGLRLGVAF